VDPNATAGAQGEVVRGAGAATRARVNELARPQALFLSREAKGGAPAFERAAFMGKRHSDRGWWALLLFVRSERLPGPAATPGSVRQRER
jgi:hypothetical protein